MALAADHGLIPFQVIAKPALQIHAIGGAVTTAALQCITGWIDAVIEQLMIYFEKKPTLSTGTEFIVGRK